MIEIDIEQLRNIIGSLPQNTKKEIMTTYQLIKQEGRQEGRQKGVEIGLEKGVKKGVINLFKRKFDIVQISDIMEISV